MERNLDKLNIFYGYFLLNSIAASHESERKPVRAMKLIRAAGLPEPV